MPRMAKVLLVLVVFVFALGVTPVSAMTTLVMGTGKPGGNYYTFGKVLAEVVNEESAESGIRIKVVASEGSVENLKGLESGKYQLALAQADMVFFATTGRGPWKKAGSQEKLRSIYEVYTEAVTCVATEASGIRSGKDLKDKRVALGTKGSGTRTNALEVLKYNLLRPSDLGQALDVGPIQAERLMYQGKLDAFFYTIGHPNPTLQKFLEYYGKARLVALPPSPGMLLQNPYFVEYPIWISDYPGTHNKEGKVPTFGIEAYLMSSNKVPAKVIYEVARLFLANLDVFKSRLKVMLEVKPLERYKIKDNAWIAPYHEGMLKLFKGVGLI
ncbi:MAG: TAXI family TRAP transporter solute-binding subunit [Desulfarculaceae bacterium]|nr:TAXI family TRAP transporter solute-binding subunit [Desulfarculaceae bacterium]MCF8073154.1 TAXI family TRAP transporter solute-binding subunit [Desulfarculaceae bacterium]MCF8101761.1 TAXI family TRAP transporter solute-binding subunit [Desulfarculaceae bacterium]MCF8118401.1 TAXI family TRAP transporter solute-binding subunit [Desulfarculaceae bacterium]